MVVAAAVADHGVDEQVALVIGSYVVEVDSAAGAVFVDASGGSEA